MTFMGQLVLCKDRKIFRELVIVQKWIVKYGSRLFYLKCNSIYIFNLVSLKAE